MCCKCKRPRQHCCTLQGLLLFLSFKLEADSSLPAVMFWTWAIWLFWIRIFWSLLDFYISRLYILQMHLSDAIEEREGLEDTIQQLTIREKELNNKTQNALKASIKVLEKKGDHNSIGIKRMGTMNDEPWRKACAELFKDRTEGWETAYISLVCEWEWNLRDASWYPFKILRTEGGDFEEHIDKEDERLAKLYEDFGVDVYVTVIDALRELNEYNGSGRFPIPVPWNFQQGRPAELEEILKYLANGGTAGSRTYP